MALTYDFWISLGAKILGSILRAVSPHIREAVRDVITDLYEKAKATDNPMDDFFVQLLATLVGVELKE